MNSKCILSNTISFRRIRLVRRIYGATVTRHKVTMVTRYNNYNRNRFFFFYFTVTSFFLYSKFDGKGTFSVRGNAPINSYRHVETHDNRDPGDRRQTLLTIFLIFFKQNIFFLQKSTCILSNENVRVLVIMFLELNDTFFFFLILVKN